MTEHSKRRAPRKSATRAGGSTNKDLANDIVGLGDRLNTIEGGTTDLSRRMDHLIKAVLENGSSLKTSRMDVREENLTQDIAISEDTNPAFDSLRDLLNVDTFNSKPKKASDEQCYTFSTISIFRHARKLVLKHFENARETPVSLITPQHDPASSFFPKPDLESPGTPISSFDIHRQDNLYPLPAPYQEKSTGVRHQPIGLPPRSMIDNAQIFYFDNVLLEPLLFRRETFLAAIEAQYRLEPSQVDKAWALCFNCILLQWLGSKSKLVLKGPSSRTLANGDTQMSMLKTLKTIVLHLDELSQSCMLNVQALLLLSLVARDYFHFSEFEKVFDRACQIAKFMRLQDHSPVNQIPSDTEYERRNLMLVLYVVDKQRVFVKGPPCHIYLFECDILLPEKEAGHSVQELELADLQLVCLLEEIYRHLYSARAKRQNPASQQETSNRLASALDAWWSHFGGLLEAPNAEAIRSNKAIRSQKLRYIFLVMQILVVRCGLEEDSKQRCLEHARSALCIIQTLCTGTGLLNGALLAVETLLRNNSIVAYFEVFENLLIDSHAQHHKTDLTMLSTVTNALGLLSHPNRADSYLARLHKRLMWCTQIAIIVCNKGTSSASIIGLSPELSDLDRSNSFDQAVRTQNVQSPDRTASMARNDSWSNVPGLDYDIIFEAEYPGSQTGLLTMSPQEPCITLTDPMLALASSKQDSCGSIPDANQHSIMDTPLADPAIASICGSMSGSAGTFVPPAMPLFFGDDAVFDDFYRDWMLQTNTDNLNDIEMQSSVT